MILMHKRKKWPSKLEDYFSYNNQTLKMQKDKGKNINKTFSFHLKRNNPKMSLQWHQDYKHGIHKLTQITGEDIWGGNSFPICLLLT